MLGSGLYLGLLLGLIAVNALFAYHAYRLGARGTAGGTGAPGRGADLIDAEAGTVQCPGCGTDNELGYRYCRSCVTELPATMGFERATDSPRGRLTR